MLAPRVPRKRQDGNRIGIGLGHATKRIFDSRLKLHGADADALPVGDAAEAVGDIHHNTLRAGENRTDALLGHRVHKGIVRKATEELHSLKFQDFRQGSAGLHIARGSSSHWFGRKRHIITAKENMQEFLSPLDPGSPCSSP